MYADDESLIAEDENKLQSEIDTLKIWYTNWKLNVILQKVKLSILGSQEDNQQNICSDIVINHYN